MASRPTRRTHALLIGASTTAILAALLALVTQSAQATPASQATPATTTPASTVQALGTREDLLVAVGFNPTHLANYAGDGTSTVDLDTLQGRIGDWYYAASNKQLTINSMTYPSWIGVDASPTSVAGAPESTCVEDGATLEAAARAALSALGDPRYDPANYDRVIYYVPQMAACPTLGGYAAIATTTERRDVLLNGRTDLLTAVHELGHTFGLDHASSLWCPSATGGVGPTGCNDFDSYGDRFDAMGSQCAGRFNSADQAQLGWLSSSTLATVDHSQTLTVSAFDGHPVAGEPEALRIQTTSPDGYARTYWFEHRIATGLDAGMGADATDGLMVHLTQDPSAWAAYAAAAGTSLPDQYGRTALIKARPDAIATTVGVACPNVHGVSTIIPGNDWTSPEGITISVLDVAVNGDVTVQVTMPSDQTLTLAVDDPTLGNSVTATGGSSADVTCPTACSYTAPGYSSVTLHPVPAPGYDFLGWDGNSPCAGQLGDCTVTMTSAQTATATFGVQPTLSVDVAGPHGAGTVTSSPAGLTCSDLCSHDFVTGTVVTLTATPAPGYLFDHWASGCFNGLPTCTLTMDASRTAGAVFRAPVVSIGFLGDGTVTSNPGGISCLPTCDAPFTPGPVTLTAHPGPGSVFVAWSGGCTNTEPTCQLQVAGDTEVVAEFADAPVTQPPPVTGPPVTGPPVTTPPPPASGGCTISGTSGKDTLVGTAGPDVICGLGGNDIIKGLGGNDVLRGGPGRDRISGGAGRDTCRSGPGRDRVRSCEVGH